MVGEEDKDVGLISELVGVCGVAGEVEELGLVDFAIENGFEGRAFVCFRGGYASEIREGGERRKVETVAGGGRHREIQDDPHQLPSLLIRPAQICLRGSGDGYVFLPSQRFAGVRALADVNAALPRTARERHQFSPFHMI